MALTVRRYDTGSDRVRRSSTRHHGLKRIVMMTVTSGALLGGPVCAWAGEALVGVTAGAFPDVVLVDSAAPQAPIARTPVLGLMRGEAITGVDQRPSTGEVFALTNANRVLVLDPATGQTRQLGVPVDATVISGAQPVGIDFNPVVDRLRLVDAGDDHNVRLNPLTFALLAPADNDLAYIGGDLNSGADPSIMAAAYDRNDGDPATPTTLFSVDSALDLVARQGAIDGNAGDGAGGGTPNGGLLTTLGPLGVDITETGGFDIARGPAGSGTGVGWAALQRQGDAMSTLYSVNIAAAAGGPARATPVGAIGVPLIGALTVVGGGVIRAAATSGAEGGQAIVTIERLGDSLEPVTVGYRTADRTAVAGLDYSPVAGILAFALGERSKQVAVPLLIDGAIEGPQSLAFELGAASGGAVVMTTASAVEITDTARLVVLTAPIVPDTLKALRRSGGLRVAFSCSDRCTIRTTLSIGRTQIGAGIAVRTVGGVGRTTVRLSKAGRVRLDRLIRSRGGRVVVTLRTTAFDASGTTSASRSAIRLTRR